MSYPTSMNLNGLRYQEKSDGSGDWELIVLDPRLSKSDVLGKIIRLVNEKNNYVQIRKEVGQWFTRKHLKSVMKIIFLSTDVEANYWRNELTRYTQLLKTKELC